MPIEPERNIEKELKAYAQQRRAQAGAPPALHPVTRKLLQAEVAQLTKKPGGGMRSLAQMLWGSWAQRLVTSSAVGAMVLVMCLLMLPALSRSKNKATPSRMELAKNTVALKEQQGNRTRSLNAPTDSLKAVDEEKQKIASAPKKETLSTKSLALADNKDNRVTPVMTPAAPPAAQASARAAAGGAAADAESSAILRKDTAAPLLQSFRRIQPPAETDRYFRDLANFDLLNSFSVEQTPGKLRMIDHDGSVYTGTVAQTTNTAKSSSARLKRAPVQPGLQEPAATNVTTPLMRAYHFRVTGTNLTLQQKIVFTGNFLESNGNLNFPENQRLNGANLPALRLNQSRVEGRVTVGKTNSFEFQAQPFKP